MFHVQSIPPMFIFMIQFSLLGSWAERRTLRYGSVVNDAEFANHCTVPLAVTVTSTTLATRRTKVLGSSRPQST
jgi:hypothetical protein